MTKKYYAVRVGKTPGIYQTWAQCQLQINGVSGAVYKSFLSEKDAKEYMHLDTSIKAEELEGENTAIAYVDGSYSRSLNKYSYGCVIQVNQNQIELSGSGSDADYIGMNNVAGEILGSVYAIKWAIENGISAIHVFHDYEGIAKWANGEWKANKHGTKQYQQFINDSRFKIKIFFTKVAAHTGVELNERADQLAKEALSEEPIDTKQDTILEEIENLFDHMMSIPAEAVDKKNIIVKNYVINDKRITNYIKKWWSILGKKKGDIKSIDYTLDLEEKVLLIKIMDKTEIEHEDTITLAKVL